MSRSGLETPDDEHKKWKKLKDRKKKEERK
jgi:hypothetical protein